MSYGTVSVAKDLLEKLLSVCNVPLEGEAMAEARTFQAKIFPQVVEHFVQESRALNKTVREQVCLEVIEVHFDMNDFVGTSFSWNISIHDWEDCN